MNATSFRVVQAQPDREQYGVPQIALFKEFMTREAYLKEFGEPAPVFNPLLRPKYWFDSSVDASDPTAEVEYTVVQKLANGTYVMRTIHMDAYEAAQVNIPDGGATTDPFMAAAVSRPAREMPVRPLLANETLITNAFAPVIVRVDKRLAKDEQDGKFTPADRAMLERIATALKV